MPSDYWSVAYVDLGDCPESPPADGWVSFEGYIGPDGNDGSNWLPTPGDSIGLKFEVHANAGHSYHISYGIWNISMWQGECLNSPRFPAYGPHTTGFYGTVKPGDVDSLWPWWDFGVCVPEDYITAVVMDSSLDYVGWVPYSEIPGDTTRVIRRDRGTRLEQPLYLTCLALTTEDPVSSHILWLKAKDYAAHCLVTPSASGGGKGGGLQHFVSPYGDTLKAITVPRDYDGLGVYFGWNLGDGMADYWEEQAFEVIDTRPILPFIKFLPLGAAPVLADFDAEPEGRDIDGDYLCHFEEYRGAIIPPGLHQRIDPLKKTVFIHLRTNLDSVVSAAMPGYIYHLNDGGFETEIFFMDSMKWGGLDTAWTELAIENYRRNNMKGRSVNFNKAGAGHWYVGYGLPTTNPCTDSVANAVTYWRWAGSDDQRRLGRRNMYGATIPAEVLWPVPGDPTDGGLIPNCSIRTIVNLDRYDSVRVNNFYSHDPDQWDEDFPRALSKTIAHEFGHTLGMLHRPSDRATPIDTSTIMTNIGILTTGQFVTSDSSYADSSRLQFSVRRPKP